MDNKIVYGILCILFNPFGFSTFVQGNTKKAIIRLILGFVPVLSTINMVLGIILAIEIFQLSDEEFKEKRDTMDRYIPNFDI